MTETNPTDGAALDKPASDSPSRARTVMLFAFLWACAHVIHTIHQGGDGDSALTEPALLLVLAAAVLVLLRPSSAHRLAVLAGVQVAAFIIQYPFVANHWTLAAFVNAGLFISAVMAWQKKQFDAVTLVSQVAPYARAAFLIAYSAAAFAKLNTTFIDPTDSCAVSLLEPMHVMLGRDLPTGLGAHGLIWTSMAVELTVPLLLLFRRTRLFGIALALAFHTLMASMPGMLVMDFTFFIVALLVLFAPVDLGDRLRQDADHFAARRPRLLATLRRERRPLLLGGLSLVATLAVLRGLIVPIQPWQFLLWPIFASAGLVLLTVGLTTLASYRLKPRRTGMLAEASRLQAIQWALIALLLFNAASPYLGLKTTSSFTMFSNLHTENNASNHLILPSLVLATYQHDLVEVQNTSHDDLRNLTQQGRLLPYHELRRQLHQEPRASVTYVRNGQTHKLAQAQDDPELVNPSYLQRKLLHFRAVDPNNNHTCQW